MIYRVEYTEDDLKALKDVLTGDFTDRGPYHSSWMSQDRRGNVARVEALADRMEKLLQFETAAEQVDVREFLRIDLERLSEKLR